MASYMLYSALITPQASSTPKKHVLIAIHHRPIMKQCMVLEVPSSTPWIRNKDDEVKTCVLDIHLEDHFGHEFSRLWNCTFISNPIGMMDMPDANLLPPGGLLAYIVNFLGCFANLLPRVAYESFEEKDKEEEEHDLAYLLADDPFEMKARDKKDQISN